MAPPANANEVGSTSESLAIETRRVRLARGGAPVEQDQARNKLEDKAQKAEQQEKRGFRLADTQKKANANGRFRLTARVL
jgi:hypothetical protein